VAGERQLTRIGGEAAYARSLAGAALPQQHRVARLPCNNKKIPLKQRDFFIG
jgi:hypothetical protein